MLYVSATALPPPHDSQTCLVLRCSWLACERVRRAQSGRKTRLSASASVWYQPKSPQSTQSSTRPMAPTGALGGAWCSGARGSRLSVCGALRAGLRLDSVHPQASGTSRSRHRLRNRAPRRWRHRGRSGASGAQVLVARLRASY